MKLREVPLHIRMPLLSKVPSRPRLHAILQQQQLLMEVIDRRPTAVAIRLSRCVQFGRIIRIVQQPTIMASISKRSSNPHRPNRIQAVGILNDATFEGWHIRRDTGPFVRQLPDDLTHMLDRRGINLLSL